MRFPVSASDSLVSLGDKTVSPVMRMVLIRMTVVHRRSLVYDVGTVRVMRGM